MSHLIRTREAAEFLGVTPAWLNLLAQKGHIRVTQDRSTKRTINYYALDDLKALRETYIFQMRATTKTEHRQDSELFNLMAQSFIRRGNALAPRATLWSRVEEMLDDS